VVGVAELGSGGDDDAEEDVVDDIVEAS